MKKSKTMRAASFLLVLTLMTSCFVGSTFAKYTSTTTGTDSAKVAKWSFLVEGTQIAVKDTPATVTFDLFNTIKDTNVNENETDVHTNLIAPGTQGSFTIDLQNLSEVNASYTIALTESNDNAIPIQYSVNGTEWKDSVADLAMTALTDVPIKMNGATDQKTVYWRWVFDGNTNGAHAGQTDVYDTALGIAAQSAAPTVTITATITATQVD